MGNIQLGFQPAVRARNHFSRIFGIKFDMPVAVLAETFHEPRDGNVHGVQSVGVARRCQAGKRQESWRLARRFRAGLALAGGFGCFGWNDGFPATNQDASYRSAEAGGYPCMLTGPDCPRFPRGGVLAGGAVEALTDRNLLSGAPSCT